MCRLMLDEVSEATLPPRCGGVHSSLGGVHPFSSHRNCTRRRARPARVALHCANHCHLRLAVDLPLLPAADQQGKLLRNRWLCFRHSKITA